MARKEGSRSILRASRNTTTGGRATRRGPGALRRACEAVVTPRSGFEPLEQRLMMARDPVMLFQFNEAATATTVTDSAAAGGVTTGTLVADGPEGEAIAPEIRTDDPSPAGGNYVHFEGDGLFKGTGGRVDLSALLNPVLGGTASLSYYIRTTQTGHADSWQAPGVTGAEQASGSDDIFWGNLGPDGEARVQAGNGGIASSGPINTGEWIRVTHTRNAVTGAVRTYVNGAFVQEAISEPLEKGAEFRSIGATTDVGNDLTAIDGYNYLSGDLDQVEVFNRELSPQEVANFYGAAAPAAPSAPGPVTATPNSPTQVTLTFANVLNESGYSVLRSGSAGGPFTLVGVTAPDQTAFVDKGLSPSTQYFYQVVAFNQAGTSAPATGSAATPSPNLDPVIIYAFNENGGDRVEDTSPENADNDGTLAGDTLPTFLAENPSPAGGS